MRFAYSIGDRFKVDLPESRHDGKVGVVIDSMMGLSGCLVVQFDGPEEEKTTFNYTYLKRI